MMARSDGYVIFGVGCPLRPKPSFRRNVLRKTAHIAKMVEDGVYIY